ncbi:hypothetical protein [Streptomyces sp. PsTaAH-124]|uniref:hypothetical protein n=1 Tax=Streptomyces sp. PsTaAH-124 TaxID=1157638 RepID=UPI000373DDC0|nr:hypothetical protein [Streptomyces sp. PsTaAH-124]
MAPFVTQHVLFQGGQVDGPSLPAGTQRNAELLAKALTGPDAAGVDPDTCHTVVPRSGADALGQVADNAASGDGLLVYWTGHCRLGPEGRLQLALDPGDGRPTEWLPARELVSTMTRSPGRDRLLILDTCLVPGAAESARRKLLQREIDRLSRDRVAVLSSIGTSPFAFAADSHAPSVFTQHLASLLRAEPHERRARMRLPELYRLLAAAMRGSGYLRPMLRNAQGFDRPLIPSALLGHAQGQPDLLPARRHSAELDQALSRYALAIGGRLRQTLGTWDTPAYEPSADAETVYRALLRSHCGFTRDSASLLRAPTSRQHLFDAVDELVEHGRNMVLVYLACHGTVRSSGTVLDLALELLDGETVLASDLVGELRKTRAEKVMMMFDVCSSSPSSPPAPLAEHFAPQEPRPGFSRLLVEWDTSAQLDAAKPEFLTGTDTGDDDRCPVPWMPDRLRGSVAPSAGNWRFDFPGAAITCLDDAGPVRTWASLLRDSIPGDLPTSPGEALSSILDPVLLDEPEGGTDESGTPQSPDAGVRLPRAPRPPAPAPAPSPAAGRQESGSGGEGPAPRRGPVHRGHRVRLRVAEGSMPLRVGRRFRVTFNYQPDGRDWVPRPDDATDDNPLDLTLRIGAGSAKVSPSVIHTRLTDDRGTPPEDFRITPRTAEPLTLRIDVVRSADGAVIQRIKSTLDVTDGDGAEH